MNEPPSENTLKELFEKSGMPLKKFFNTSGKKYRELGLKDKLANATEDEMISWLASDGMLIKRPLLTDGKQVTVGYKDDMYEEAWG